MTPERISELERLLAETTLVDGRQYGAYPVGRKV